MSLSHIAYIGIGGNVGDRFTNCKAAIDKIALIHRTSVDRVSPFYESEAVGCSDKSGDFLNCVARISTELGPQELLGAAMKIECELGRPKNRKKSLARTIDIDILFYDDLVLNAPNLTIPHPELTKRLFVLAPLCDIAPLLIHPVVNITVAELKKRCKIENPMRISHWKGRQC